MDHSITPNVRLFAYTPDPDKVAGEAAAKCYRGKNPERSLKIALGQGHESVIEHVSFTFEISGVSRSLLAQITRHRLASFSVESQRYVSYDDENGFRYIIPPAVDALGKIAVDRYNQQMETMQIWYNEWCSLIHQEDARMVLPNAYATSFVVTMNARELRHFFELRMCHRAQWEIQRLANMMYKEVVKVSPAIFGDAGPSCRRGKCKEGKMCCGKPWREDDDN